jgi:hypothetical protein
MKNFGIEESANNTQIARYPPRPISFSIQETEPPSYLPIYAMEILSFAEAAGAS